MLFLVLHLLGDLLEIGSRSVYFAASLFYTRISRVPNGFAASAFLHQLKCRAYVRLNSTPVAQGPPKSRRTIASTDDGSNRSNGHSPKSVDDSRRRKTRDLQTSPRGREGSFRR